MTKGWIKNLDTGVIKSFQFNPEGLQYSRGATYNEITSPGMPYPVCQYVRGNARTFDIELFVYDNPYTGKIDEYRNFIEALLPPESNYISCPQPPKILVSMGYFIKTCVLENLDTKDELFDSYLRPTQTRLTLSLRQVES